jgi:hypothetical protein
MVAGLLHRRLDQLVLLPFLLPGLPDVPVGLSNVPGAIFQLVHTPGPLLPIALVLAHLGEPGLRPEV